MNRPFYFGAGPAHLPEEVLLDVQAEWLNWQSTQLSILEIGHRTPQFEARMASLTSLFRSVLNVPDHYHVLFMGLPTRAHFGLIPQHFLNPNQQAGYWLTGHWSNLAYQEAQKLKQAFCIEGEWTNKNPAYVYFTPNETIEGVRFQPSLKEVTFPVIADMTSCLFTEVIEVTDYAMIFAGSQKNFGAAGLGVVIIEDQFLNTVKELRLPTYLDYRTYAKTHSMCVTPPVFNCELTFKMLEWMQSQGGLNVLAAQNKHKAKCLYDYIDSTDFYINRIEKQARSRVNVTFFLKNRALEGLFFAEANAHGLIGLQGHRSQGGVRVGLYNAVSNEAVDQLIIFMKTFASRNA